MEIMKPKHLELEPEEVKDLMHRAGLSVKRVGELIGEHWYLTIGGFRAYTTACLRTAHGEVIALGRTRRNPIDPPRPEHAARLAVVRAFVNLKEG
jgi:hypothetical protein